MKENTYVNALDMSKIINVPEPTLRTWRYQKVGPPYSKVGRSVRYNVDKVVDWMEENEISSAG